MNISIFYFLHSFAFVSPWFDQLVQFFAVPFIYIIISIITITLIWKAKIFEGGFNIKSMWVKGYGIAIILSTTLFTYILANLLKIVIMMDRPSIALNNVYTLIPESGFAFPSGHSATIAAFAFAVFFKNKKLGYVCFIAMLLIGLARVVAGVHFPVDIVGGFAIGFMVAYLSKRL